MGQVEVFEYLKGLRLSGDHEFHSVPEISKAIRQHKLYSRNWRGVWAAVVQLEAFGFLDVKKVGKLRDFRRVVRVKREYL